MHMKKRQKKVSTHQGYVTYRIQNPFKIPINTAPEFEFQDRIIER